MRRMAVAMVLIGAAWMGLAREAQAQVQIMPTGPLALKPAEAAFAPQLSQQPAPWKFETEADVDKFYPGRTRGGGSRMLRPNPPPSFLKPRKE